MTRPRSFLDLDALEGTELRAILDDAVARAVQAAVAEERLRLGQALEERDGYRDLVASAREGEAKARTWALVLAGAAAASAILAAGAGAALTFGH